MHRTPSPTAAFWLAAFTYFIWGFTFLASRVAQNYGSPFVLLFWRFALAFVLMNLLCLTGRFHVRLRGRDLRRCCWRDCLSPCSTSPVSSTVSSSRARRFPAS